MNNNELNRDELDSINLNDSQGSLPHPEPQAIIPGPSITPPKKPKKGLIITLIIAFVLIAGGVAAYFALTPPKATTTSTETTNTQEQTATTPDDNTDYAKILIDKIKTDENALVSQFKGLKVKDIEANSPAYKYDSNKYYIAGTFGYSLVIENTSSDTVASQDFATTTLSTVNKALASDTSLTKNDTESYTVYQSSQVICSIYKGSQPLSVSCANKRDYAPLAKAIEPFANALFIELGNEYTANTVLYTPKIAKKDNGYANAQVGMSGYENSGGSVGLFYSKDDNWKYWRGVQSILNCEDFDTFALQTSFAGDACYDTATQTESTVKVRS